MTRQLHRVTGRNKIFLLIAGVVLLIAILACNSIGFFDPSPPPPDNGLESTVAAMNATIEALEVEQAAPPTTEPTPNIIIVTATATNTPLPSPTPIATVTPLPILLAFTIHNLRQFTFIQGLALASSGLLRPIVK